MKKVFIALFGAVTVIAISICFTACGNSNATIEDIAGVWVADSYVSEDNEEVVMNETMANKIFISIEKNGSAQIAKYGYAFDGKITNNGDNTFTFKCKTSSQEDVTYTYEDERLSVDRSEEYGHKYMDYYAKTTMNTFKASLTGTDRTEYQMNDEGSSSDSTFNIQCQIISLDIPTLWTGKYDFDCKINKDNTGYVTLYQKASRKVNGGGNLVTIKIEEASNDYTVYPDYKYLGTLKQNGFDYNVIALYPTDVQFSSGNQAEYEKMQKDLDQIVNSIEGINGTQFDKQ